MFRTVCPGWLSPVVWACALAMSAPVAHAQVQATATLSNLNVRVIDVNTTDKIKAAATWGGALSAPYDNSPVLLTDVFAAGTQSLTEAPFASATFGGGNIRMTTTLAQNDLAQVAALPGVYISNNSYEYAGRAINPDTGLMTSYVDRINSNYTNVYVTLGQSLVSGYNNDSVSLPYTTLTLTPGTVAVVSGDMLTSVTTDSRWLAAFAQQVGLPAESGYNWGALTANVSASVDVTLERMDVVSNPTGGSTTTSDFHRAEISSNDAFDTSGVIYRNISEQTDPQNATTSMSQSFSMVVQNLGSQDMVFNLNLLQSVTTLLNGTHSSYSTERIWDLSTGVPVDVVTPPVPNIPEPGTWMLMGMGLAGVAWARRRQTQTSTQTA